MLYVSHLVHGSSGFLVAAFPEIFQSRAVFFGSLLIHFAVNRRQVFQLDHDGGDRCAYRSGIGIVRPDFIIEEVQMIFVHQKTGNLRLVIVKNATYGNNAVDIQIRFQNHPRKKVGLVEFGGLLSDHKGHLLVVAVQPSFQIFLQRERSQILHIG